MRLSSPLARFAGLALASFAASVANADSILFESATLDNVGSRLGDVNSATVSEFVYTGVRFELDRPVITSAIGGHFVGSGNFFGALVELDDANDTPDSIDLTTPDVLGVVTAEFPDPSAEIGVDLSLHLDPGWYAIVFGSGLFGTAGVGGIPISNAAAAIPSYLSGQQGAWFAIPAAGRHRRIDLQGTVVPEPTVLYLVLPLCIGQSLARRR